MPKIKPEDCFNIEALVGTTEVGLGQVPVTKFERKIYSIVLSDVSGSTNTLTLRQYASDGTTLQKSWQLRVGANETIQLVSSEELPIISIPAGSFIKAVATAASIQLLISAYDL